MSKTNQGHKAHTELVKELSIMEIKAFSGELPKATLGRKKTAETEALEAAITLMKPMEAKPSEGSDTEKLTNKIRVLANRLGVGVSIRVNEAAGTVVFAGKEKANRKPKAQAAKPTQSKAPAKAQPKKSAALTKSEVAVG